MIIPAQGLRIVLAVRPVDFRCGHDALAGLVQNTLGLDPHSGLIVVFRSKRADRLKILLWDGTGLVLVYKRLGRDGRFEWPQISDGVMHLTRVQFEGTGSEWANGLSRRRQLRRTDSDPTTCFARGFGMIACGCAAVPL
ncbi:IS66 family insertion sequence element accessory protein TnpB [Bradyrhizobium sp. YCK136]